MPTTKTSTVPQPPKEDLSVKRDQLLDADWVSYLASMEAESVEWLDQSANSVLVPVCDGDDDDSWRDPATFCIVGECTVKDSFLSPNANYRCPTKVVSQLAAAKLTMALGKPKQEEFAKDWNDALATINTLRQRRCDDPKASMEGVLFGVNRAQPDKFRARHALFGKIEHPVTDADELEVLEKDKDPSDEFTTAGWPILPDAKAERDYMVKNETYRVEPLPAVGMDGQRIRPSQYMKDLHGALVAVCFTMSHTVIRSSSTNRFMADIMNVRVLAPPVNNDINSPQKITALKRKLMHADPFSSKKKARMDPPRPFTPSPSPPKPTGVAGPSAASSSSGAQTGRGPNTRASRAT
ncbi:hypothetical protein K435DRAFT_876939 [Dendrothele bispora CBS 962.96]|uniref:Uncharacterized protein n=1 Tax=Dendrothele bispora (strain CBS 962.96) TaxID=1314807 RepID=A0A4S8KRC7_DENBC|nr:hypothetical protein K435DRAFT_876939 [Dendrothele bispora CBS 962.96]